MFGSIKRRLSRRESYSSAVASSSPSTRNTSLLSPASAASAKPAFSFRSTMVPEPTRRPDRPGMNAFTTPSDEPPPAYTPRTAPAEVAASPVQPMTADDPYAFLATFDTIFLIDDSGSMAGRPWREVEQALKAITPICTARDADGVDVHFLNAVQMSQMNVKHAGTIIEMFQSVRPSGATPTGTRLDKIIRPYFQQYTANPDTTKPINIIVITDGIPTDDLEATITWAAKHLDKLDAPAWQVGIQFFQVGKDREAQAYLKSLDDDLSRYGQMRDIVDTVPFTGDGDNTRLTPAGILKVVLGSVNRRIDRRSVDLHTKG